MGTDKKNDEIMERMFIYPKNIRMNTDFKPLTKIYIPNNDRAEDNYPTIDYTTLYMQPKQNFISLIPRNRNDMTLFTHTG